MQDYEWLGDTPKDAWMETASGGRIHIFDPQPGEIQLDDIVHALGLTCRYGGHCRVHYSVAQHSVHVADIIKKRGGDETLQLQALLHDAAEAYIGDLPRPVKMWMSQFKVLDNFLTSEIMKAFKVPLVDGDLGPEIHYVDMNICHDEGKAILQSGLAPDSDVLTFDPETQKTVREKGVDFTGGKGPWWSQLESFGMTIAPWEASMATHVLRKRILSLMGDLF